MTLRVLVPLLGILAALAWGATHLVHGTTLPWFERDVSLRARLVASGARDALSAHLATDDPREPRTIGACGGVALLAPIATSLVRRFTWRSWTTLAPGLHVIEEANR